MANWYDNRVGSDDIVAKAITMAKLAAELQENLTFLAIAQAAAFKDSTPQLIVRGLDSTGNAGTCTIQAKDASGNNVSHRVMVRTWIADAEFSEPDPQNDYSVSTGEEMIETEANADYQVISDATGLIIMAIAVAAPATVYCMAEINGRIYSSGAIVIT